MAMSLEDVLPEAALHDAVDLAVRVVEAAGAGIIFLGAVVAVALFLRELPRRRPERFTGVRLTLGRFLALGLEFQLASDILRTAVAPSFEELGKLAVVATIRTALNFFLSREIREETAQVAAVPGARSAAGPVAASEPGGGAEADDRSRGRPG